MIIKGKSVGGARRLAKHLVRADTNERVEVLELRGVVSEDLKSALLEMEAVAAGARTEKPFYHGSINTRADERLTVEQRMHAIDRLEATLGLTGQSRAVVLHVKEGREHCHIVWSRIDQDRMVAISDSHNYRKHEQVARELEREFGLERVQGAHVERDGKERPKRTPSHSEMLQADRTGLTPQEIKEQVTALWRQTNTGQEFAAELSKAGFVLARGDRRDFVIIDRAGGTHSMARRIEGARAADIRERMTDLDPASLPSVTHAKQMQRIRREFDAAARGRATDEVDQAKARARDKGPDWTDRGGMVDQQRAAMDWVKDAHEDRKARTEQTDRKQQQSAQDQRDKRLYELWQKYESGHGDDRENENDPGRERGPPSR